MKPKPKVKQYQFGCHNCFRLWKQTKATKKFCNKCGSPKVENLSLRKQLKKGAMK